MGLFRRSTPKEPLVVTMTGVRLGDRVLILAGDDAEMPIDLAARAGLSGEASVRTRDQNSASRIAARAERRGVLVDAAPLATAALNLQGHFDVAVADDRARPPVTAGSDSLLSNVFDTLRRGGRLIVMRPAARTGRWFRLRQSQHRTDEELTALSRRLASAGFKAARQIGARGGTLFIEAVRGS